MPDDIIVYVLHWAKRLSKKVGKPCRGQHSGVCCFETVGKNVVPIWVDDILVRVVVYKAWGGTAMCSSSFENG